MRHDPFNADVFGFCHADNPAGNPFNNEVFGVAGSGVAFGPMTEAEAKAAAAKTTALVPSSSQPTSGAMAWFKQPTWKDGPPRWQVGAAGTAVGVGALLLVFALTGRK